MLNLEDFNKALPTRLKDRATQENLDTVNKLLNDPDYEEIFKENFVCYMNVLADSKLFNIEQYINAIKYCTYKLNGFTNFDSYVRTFPDRYQKHLLNNIAKTDIESYVSAYNRTKLVQNILEQAYIPVWLMNQSTFQEAINTQVHLMRTAKSEKVRSDAANSLLNHLKPPQESKVKLDITQNTNDVMQDITKAIRDLAAKQELAIKSGNATVKEIAEGVIIEGTFSEVGDDDSE